MKFRSKALSLLAITTALMLPWPGAHADVPPTALGIRYTGTDFEGFQSFELQWNAVPHTKYLLQQGTFGDTPGLNGGDLVWKTIDALTPTNDAGVTEVRVHAGDSRDAFGALRPLFYRLVLPQPEILDVQPTFVDAGDSNATFYIIGQLLPTNALVVLNGHTFSATNDGSGNLRIISLNGLPPGEPVIGTITVMDAGSNVVATLPVQSPLFYGPTAPLELLQGQPEEPPASPQALLAAYLSKRGYDYYKAQSDMSSTGAHTNPYFKDNELAGDMPDSGTRWLSKKGYDYYQAQSALNTAARGGKITKSRSNIQNNRVAGSVGGITGGAVAGIVVAARSSGELQAEETDLALPGVGLDFAWTRTYRSRTGPTTAQGAGWDFSYNVCLTQNSDGTMTLRPGNGRADTFYLTGTNLWARDEYFCTIVDLNKDGLPDVQFADGGKWLFHVMNGDSSTLRLYQIVDRNGNTITLEHDVADRLTAIIDDQGRTNTVAYNGAGQISSVTDFSGRTVRYEYSVSGDLTSVISPVVTNTPTGNDFPGGLTNRYTYSSGQPDLRLNHNLTSCIDGAGQTWLAVTYSPTNNPASLDFDRVDGLVCGGTTHFRTFPQPPSKSNNFAVLKIIMRDAVGNVTEEFYDSRQRCVRQLEYTGRSNPDLPVTENANRPTGKLRVDDPDYFETTWTWNPDSLCTTESRPGGDSTEVVYQRSFNQNNARSNHAKAAKMGEVRVIHQRACCGGADLDGDGVPDITQLSWCFEYDPRFGSPAGRKVHGLHRGDHQPMPVYGKKLYVGNLPFSAADQSASFRGPRQSVSLDGNYSSIGRDRMGRPAINTALNSSARAINTKGTGATVRLGAIKVNQTAGEECDAAFVDDDFCVSVTDPRGNVTFADYDDHGNRLRLRKRPELLFQAWDGTLAAFGYNAYGQLTDFTNAPDANGRYYWERYVYSDDPFTPSRAEPAAIIADADGLRLTNLFEYDARGNLTRCIDPLGKDWLYTYNALDQLVRVETPTHLTARSKTDFTYDHAENVQEAIQELRDDTDALVHNITNRFEYDALDQCTTIARQVSPGVFVTNKFSYDGNGQLVSVQSPLAVSGADPHAITLFEYDERGLLFHEIGAPGSSGGGTNEFAYNLRGSEAAKRIIYVPPVDRSGFGSSQSEYDGFGRLVRFTDAMSNVVSYVYDRNGNVTRAVFFGELNDSTGSSSNVRLAEQRWTYDALNRLTESRELFFDPLTQSPFGDGASVTTFAYAPNGDCTSVTADNGHVTRYAYDTAGRLASVTDPKTNVMSLGYDAAGNLTSMVSSERSDITPGTTLFSRSFAYDALGRCVQTVDNVGNTNSWSYDSPGRVRRSKLGRELLITFHDDLNRPILAIGDLDGDGAPDLAADVNTSWTYDDNSRCVSVTDDNTNTTYTVYDSLDRPIQIINADGTACNLIWSPRSNLLRQQDPNGNVISNRYDLLDRLVARDITPGSTVASTTTFERYAYDGRSQLVAATNDVSHSELDYDSMGNCRGNHTDGWNLLQAFDSVGNTISVTYPSGLTIGYTYDACDQVTQINRCEGCGNPWLGDLVAAYAYDGPGRVGRITRPNGINTRISWDGLTGTPNASGDFGWRQVNGINHQVAGGGAIIDRRIAKFDRNQNRLERSQIAPFVQNGPLTTNTWTYDPLSRATESTLFRNNSFASKSYILDGNGNRQIVLSNGLAQPYVMDAAPLPGAADFQMNQYTITPFAMQTYDENGNLTSRGSVTGQLLYQYDYADRLVAVLDGSSGLLAPVATYTYGPLGQRLTKTVYPPTPLSPITTEYIYGTEGWRVRQVRRAGVLEASFILDGSRSIDDEVVRLTAAGAPQYFHNDDLGNALALTSANGTVIERYDYDDFGAPIFLTSDGIPLNTNAAPSGNTILFHSMEWESETAFHHSGGNYSDPAIAQPISPSKLTPKVAKESHGKFRLPLRSITNPWSGGGGGAGGSVLKKEEGGRHTPFHNKYRPAAAQFGSLIDSSLNLLDDGLARSSAACPGGARVWPMPGYWAAKESRAVLKTYFETGDIPTQDQFYGTASKHTRTGHVTLLK